MGFFEDALRNAPEDARESFCHTLFLQDSSPYAKEMRLRYYRSVLKSMGENVTIGENVKFVHPESISLGNDVVISDDCTLIGRDGGEIVLGDRVILSERVYLDTEHSYGYIHVGEDVYIGTGTTLFGHLGLEIGAKTLLAQNITITPYSHIFEDPEKYIWHQGGHSKKVTIGKDCYLGMGVCVMYAGDIGDGSVIGAGSVVVKPIAPYSVAVGVPAEVIRKRA